MANQPGRTRDWHAELDEAEAEVDEPFKNSFGEIMYPGDPHAKPQNVYNCRCTLVSIVKGFKKVGENTAENVDNTAESCIIKTEMFRSLSDPMFEVAGSAFDSNRPDMVQRLEALRDDEIRKIEQFFSAE